MQRERENQQSGKKEVEVVQAGKEPHSDEIELLGCKERQVHHDSIGRGILIFLQVLNKDVKEGARVSFCPEDEEL